MNGALVEMFIGEAWVDISSDVYTRNPITITRGKADESSQVAPSKCTLTLNNRAGKYSPRNPLSPYYGLIGRNTPVRVAKTGAVPTFDASASPSAGVGTLSWTHTPVGSPNGIFVSVVQDATSADQVSGVTYGGVAMTLVQSTATSTPTGWKYAYLLNEGIPTGPQTVTVTVTGAATKRACSLSFLSDTGTVQVVDLSNTASASGANPNASTQPDIFSVDSLAVGVLYSGQDAITSIAPGTGAVDVLEHDFGTQCMSVIRKTAAVASGNFVSISWVATADSYHATVYAITSTTGYRFYGEVASFPPRWEASTNDAYVSIECAGLLRRLNQGIDPPASGLRVAILEQAGLFNYWPLDGGPGTTYSLDIGGTSSLTSRFYAYPATGPNAPVFTYGSGDLGTYLPASFQMSSDGTGYMRGDVGSGAATMAVDFLFKTPRVGELTMQFKDYSDFYWAINVSGNFDSLQVAFTDPSTGPVAFAPVVTDIAKDGLLHHARLQVVQAGADSNWALLIDGATVSSGTQVGYNLNGMSMVQFFYDMVPSAPQLQTPVSLGHVAVWENTLPSASDLYIAANGYIGEAAGDRIERIATAAGYSITTIGDPADTQTMGPQYSEGLLTQLRDAEGTDFGTLGEPRDSFGLLYRTKRSLYNQVAKATIDYSARQLSPPFEPVDDDQQTRNDITVTKRDAGSTQASVDTGALSTQEPPNGVGRYADSVTVNTETEGSLPDIAKWLLNQGTLDEARFPSVTVNFSAASITPAIESAVLSLDLGDLLVISNMDALGIYDDVSLLVLGYAETITPAEHVIQFTCGPASSYNVAVWGSAVGSGPDRYDTGGSTLAAAYTSSATSLSVSTAAGNALWTTTLAEFPFGIYVAGERMTVTAITGASSPQTFTVTRAVNGVSKAQSSGAAVRLWDTPRYAL